MFRNFARETILERLPKTKPYNFSSLSPFPFPEIKHHHQTTTTKSEVVVFRFLLHLPEFHIVRARSPCRFLWIAFIYLVERVRRSKRQAIGESCMFIIMNIPVSIFIQHISDLLSLTSVQLSPRCITSSVISLSPSRTVYLQSSHPSPSHLLYADFWTLSFLSANRR